MYEYDTYQHILHTMHLKIYHMTLCRFAKKIFYFLDSLKQNSFQDQHYMCTLVGLVYARVQDFGTFF